MAMVLGATAARPEPMEEAAEEIEEDTAETITPIQVQLHFLPPFDPKLKESTNIPAREALPPQDSYRKETQKK